MSEMRPFLKNKKAANHKRGGLFVFIRDQRQTRRGQTLVEYALIVAYIAVVAMQAMDYMGFAAKEQLVYVDCVAIVANTNNQGIDSDLNRANEMTAVTAYASASSTWGNLPTSWTGPAATSIINRIHGIVYSN